jgi:hypothetical protein
MFKLPQSKESLPKTEHIETVLRQISAQSVLTGDSFSNGEIQFRFSSTAVDKYFIPSKSFFQIQAEITRADGTPLLKNDGVALAQNCAANLFSSCQVKLGGQVITNVNAHLAQIDTLRHRMDKSNDWLDSIGDTTNLWGDWASRRDRISLDSAVNLRENGPAVDIHDMTDGITPMPNNPIIQGGRYTAPNWDNRWQWRWRFIPRRTNGDDEFVPYATVPPSNRFNRLNAMLRHSDSGRYCLELFMPMNGAGDTQPAPGGPPVAVNVAFPNIHQVINKYDKIKFPGGEFIVDRVLTTLPSITAQDFGLSAVDPNHPDDSNFGMGSAAGNNVFPEPAAAGGMNLFIFFVDTDENILSSIGQDATNMRDYIRQVTRRVGCYPNDTATYVADDAVTQSDSGAGTPATILQALLNSYNDYGATAYEVAGQLDNPFVSASQFERDQARRGWSSLFPGQIQWQPMVADAGVGVVELLWQPPSSLFHSHKQALPQAAEMEITLHPAIDYKRAAVETRGQRSLVPAASTTATDGDYRFNITKMIFYMCETRNNVFNQDRFVLDLEEITAQQSVIENTNFQEISFTVNRATKALTAAFVDRRQDTDTRTSRAVFKSYGNNTVLGSGSLRPEHEKLQTIVFDYAGQQYPVNQTKFEYDPVGDPYPLTGKPVVPKNWFTQRYLESLLFQGKMDDAAAVESFRDWFDRGYYIHWQCDKPSRNENTRAIIKTEFKDDTDVDMMYLLLFEHHRNVVEITLNAAKRIDSIQRFSVL